MFAAVALELKRWPPQLTGAWGPASTIGFMLAMHTPPGAQICPEAQSLDTEQPVEPLTQTLRALQTCSAPHCAFDVQVAGAPSARTGKSESPTPRPADAGSAKKSDSAPVTSSHFVVAWPSRFSAIDPEASSITYRSSGIGSAVTVSPAQLSSPEPLEGPVEASEPGPVDGSVDDEDVVPEPTPLVAPPAPVALAEPR